jgi:hypothetical protein
VSHCWIKKQKRSEKKYRAHSFCLPRKKEAELERRDLKIKKGGPSLEKEKLMMNGGAFESNPPFKPYLTSFTPIYNNGKTMLLYHPFTRRVCLDWPCHCSK